MSLYTFGPALNINNYELNIISAEKDSKGKNLKKYSVNGTDFIGVYEGENFELQFKNNSWKQVQVRISIDGTDIITGNEADLLPAGEMWLVSPYSKITLKAWPETTRGGSSFIFGKAGDSVAAHTHGNMDSKGIISAAVFAEPDIQYTYTRSWNDPWGGQVYGNGTRLTSSGCNSGTFSSANSSINLDYNSVTMDSMDISNISEASLPAVGAGEYADQEIQKVAGLNNPTYQTVLMVKYQWWTQLKSNLRKLGFDKADMSNIGFPGEPSKMIDLGSTPKKGKQPKPAKKPRKKYVELDRFNA